MNKKGKSIFEIKIAFPIYRIAPAKDVYYSIKPALFLILNRNLKGI